MSTATSPKHGALTASNTDAEPRQPPRRGRKRPHLAALLPAPDSRDVTMPSPTAKFLRDERSRRVTIGEPVDLRPPRPERGRSSGRPVDKISLRGLEKQDLGVAFAIRRMQQSPTSKCNPQRDYADYVRDQTTDYLDWLDGYANQHAFGRRNPYGDLHAPATPTPSYLDDAFSFRVKEEALRRLGHFEDRLPQLSHAAPSRRSMSLRSLESTFEDAGTQKFSTFWKTQKNDIRVADAKEGNEKLAEVEQHAYFARRRNEALNHQDDLYWRHRDPKLDMYGARVAAEFKAYAEAQGMGSSSAHAYAKAAGEAFLSAAAQKYSEGASGKQKVMFTVQGKGHCMEFPFLDSKSGPQ